MAKERRQVLTNQTMNSKGYIVLSDGVDWSRFVKNPVLLREHESWRNPIGKVVDIKREGDSWTGRLEFSNTPDGLTAKQLYEEGVLNAVSIGGSVVKSVRNDITYAVRFNIFEISLVSIPANEDAVSYDVEKDGLRVMYDIREETALETLSASDDAIITKYITQQMKLENEPDKAAEVVALKNGNPASEPEKDEKKPETLNAEPENKEEEKLSFARSLGAAFKEAFGISPKTAEPAKVAEPEKPETLKAEPEPEKEKLNLNQPDKDAKVFVEEPSKAKPKMKVTSFLSWLYSGEGKSKTAEIAQLSAETINNPQAFAHPDNASVRDYLREFGAVLGADSPLLTYLSQVTFQVSDGRRESISAFAERLSSGANTADFIENSPDLGKAVWLSMFVRKLFPENSWAARTLKASGMDKQGMIWVQSAANPAIYMGRRAPLGANTYTYDDIARGLTTQVFAVQPTLWQPSNTDILAYDDRSTGISTIMDKISESIHQYTLQVGAEEAGEHVAMTGTAFAADGWFPSLNPAATGNITSMGVKDLALLTAKFNNENFKPEQYQGVVVLDSRFVAEFKLDNHVTSILQKNAGDVKPRFLQFDAWDIYSRSRVTGWDTATSAIIDPEWYLDGRVDEDGSIPIYTPPVIPATTLGAGLAFMPDQLIMAMGNVNVHMVSSPENYGWIWSTDIRYGAGVLRENGAGVKVVYPTVVPDPAPEVPDPAPEG